MLHVGLNSVDGVLIEVVRKNCRRINLRVRRDGRILLTLPKWWATLHTGEQFLKSKWTWLIKARKQVLERPVISKVPVTAEEKLTLNNLLAELNATWSARLNEPNVTWHIRSVKSFWGCCHWRKRYITYNAELAHVSRELVEYVVVHEFTHFAVHSHGRPFYALMDERLPDWRIRRAQLAHRSN